MRLDRQVFTQKWNLPDRGKRVYAQGHCDGQDGKVGQQKRCPPVLKSATLTSSEFKPQLKWHVGGCMWMREQNSECLMRSLSQTGAGFLFACPCGRKVIGMPVQSERSDLSCSSCMWLFEVHWECFLKCTGGVCNWLDWQAFCRLFHMVRLLLAHSSWLHIYIYTPQCQSAN